MTNRSVFFLFVFTNVLIVQSAKILGVFPTPSISHQVVFRKITQELVNRGHEVTVITPNPAYRKGLAPSNLKEIDVHDVSYSIMRETFEEMTGKLTKLNLIRPGLLKISHIFKVQLLTPQVQELINNKNIQFDLILIESVVPPAIVFTHIFKAPVILVSSMGGFLSNYDVLGAPTHPFLYPATFRDRIYNLSLLEKLRELYIHCFVEYLFYLNELDEFDMMKEVFGPDIPTFSKLTENVDMLFVNINPIWADNQPMPPGVIYMGGIHQLPRTQLPKDLKAYLDSSKHGVIYLSFGTNALSNFIPPEKVKIIIKVLSELPYDVLWKWDKDELPGKSDNIKIGKWFPQADLLHHPNVKLFITQAGLQSTDEAITAGVPLIALPVLGDQWFNAEKYVKHGIGIKLDFSTLYEEEFRNAIKSIIDNESDYRQNVGKLRNIMQDQPESPVNKTMWWIEYVIRHGGAKHLRAPAANISYYEYFAVDVLLVLVTTLFIILFTILLALFLVIKFLTQLLFDKKKITINKKKN